MCGVKGFRCPSTTFDSTGQEHRCERTWHADLDPHHVAKVTAYAKIHWREDVLAWWRRLRKFSRAST